MRQGDEARFGGGGDGRGRKEERDTWKEIERLTD